MKRFLVNAAMLVVLSAPAFAAKNSEKVNIAVPVTVGATHIPAASYKVTWTGTGNTGQVTLTNGKSVVTLPAKVVEQKNNVNSVHTSSENGTTVLKGFTFSNVTVEFSSSPASGQ